MCKECVTALPRAFSLLRIENPMRLLRAKRSQAASVHKARIYVVPEVGVEPTRF
jgi:hypothetical protein